MTNNNMITTRVNAHGLIIQELADELDKCGISYNRSQYIFLPEHWNGYKLHYPPVLVQQVS